MPSTLPVIRIRTDEDTVTKIKTIAKYNNRSVSKEIERLILKHIWEFEAKNGEITVDYMTPTEIVSDINDRIKKNPPYGDHE